MIIVVLHCLGFVCVTKMLILDRAFATSVTVAFAETAADAVPLVLQCTDFY